MFCIAAGLRSSRLADVELVFYFNNIVEMILAHRLLYKMQGGKKFNSLDNGACQSISEAAERLPYSARMDDICAEDCAGLVKSVVNSGGALKSQMPWRPSDR